MDPIFLTGGIVAGFAVGMGAGVLLERYRMNNLIKASFRHVPGFPHRIAIIKEQHVHQAQPSKSEVMAEYAQKHGFPLVALPLAECDPSDAQGYPRR